MRSFILVGAGLVLLTSLLVADANAECHCGCWHDGEQNHCYVESHGCSGTERDECGDDCCSEIWGPFWE